MPRESVFLIGYPDDDILESKLPTVKQVISFFFYNYKIENLSIRESALRTVRKCTKIWEKTEIPLVSETNSIEKVKRLHKLWCKVSQNRSLTTDQQKIREFEFQEKLKDIFEMRKPNVRRTPLNEIEFIYYSKKATEAGSSKVQKQENNGIIDTQKRKIQTKGLAGDIRNYELSDVATEETADERDDSDEEYRSNVVPQKRKIQILNNNLCSTLDRTNTSTRDATRIISVATQSLGIPLQSVSLSKDTVRRMRMKSRKQVAAEIATKLASDINEDKNVKLVVQWDGKILQNHEGKNVDQLPILIKGRNIDQLLGVGNLEKGTGANQATEILKLLKKHNISENIVGVCFDTTSVNTGNKIGTCTLLEKSLDRKLLHFACRHHIFEVILRAVFDEIMGSTSSSDVALFKKFQTAWKNNEIQTEKFNCALNDPKIHKQLKQKKDDLLKFTTTVYKEKHPRDDYKELLELIIIFLGESPNEKIRFKKPGAFHHARWMAKALYSIKMYLFRDQFKLTTDELSGLRQISQFIVLLYQKVWFTATKIDQAPFNDLEFLKDLASCKAIKSNIRKAALHKFVNHLWYLNQELVGLAFFDERLSVELKQKMVIAVKQNASYLQPNNRAIIDPKKRNIVKSLESLTLDKFVTMKTMQFFVKLGIKSDFLDTDPKLWSTRADFNNGMEIIKSLPCVNDNAERAVHLATVFNNSITNNKEQKQFLYNVVRDHRARYPDCTKKMLTQKSPHNDCK